MKIHSAMLAACVSTLALVTIDVASAQKAVDHFIRPSQPAEEKDLQDFKTGKAGNKKSTKQAIGNGPVRGTDVGLDGVPGTRMAKPKTDNAASKNSLTVRKAGDKPLEYLKQDKNKPVAQKLEGANQPVITKDVDNLKQPKR